jgi:hypothetical protein
MANKKITELSELELVDVVDDLDQIILIVVDNSSSPAVTKKIKLSSLDSVIERSVSTAVTTAAKFTLEPIGGTTIDSSYTIPVGYNAISIDPVLSPGVTVTVSPGSEWIIK